MTSSEDIKWIQYEPGTPEYDVYEGPARDLNNVANDYAYDPREYAIKLATAVISEAPDASEPFKDFVKANKIFRIVQLAAENLMPARNAFEQPANVSEGEPFASSEVWFSMNKEQQAKASELRAAIAAGPLKEYGVTEATLRVVQTEKDGQSFFALVHTGAGIDIGEPKKRYSVARSYRSVMNNDALFRVEINGVTYDSRQGMTSEVYDAKVADALARGVTLPNSHRIGDDWTFTMLTGKPLTSRGKVSLRYVYAGQVNPLVVDPNDGNRALRVCPAVEIA